MQFYINNVMNDNLYIADGFQIPGLNTTIETREVKGRDGFLLGEKRVQGYNFVIPFHYVNHADKNYQDIMIELVQHLETDEDVRLQFEGQAWYWEARFTGTINLKPNPHGFVSFELNCIIADPHKYSNERYNTISEDDHLTLLNNGTAATYPTFKATAKKDSTMFMATKNDEDYILMGRPESAFKEVKDLSPVVYSAKHKNLTGWTRRTTEIPDKLSGGLVGGTIVSNGSALTVNNFGPDTRNQWYGGAVQRSLSATLTDWEFTTCMNIHRDVNHRSKGLIKGMMHLSDESGNLVASIGLVDATINKKNTSVLVRIYDKDGNSRNMYYSSGALRDAYRFGKVYIRLRKEGNRFTSSTWRYRKLSSGRTEVISQTKRTFIDKSGAYDRGVRQLTAYIAKYTTGNNDVPFWIYETTINRLLPAEVDVTPLIIKQGDEIEIDHHQELMLLNGEPVTEFKDFGSSYFDAPVGLTEVFIEPPDIFDVEAEWRDRFH